MREDGVWFLRRRNLRGLWGAWDECKGRPYEFSAYIDPRAGNAKLPQKGVPDASESSDEQSN